MGKEGDRKIQNPDAAIQKVGGPQSEVLRRLA